jgi:branched-chain amino acid transport system ATP-binding protein
MKENGYLLETRRITKFFGRLAAVYEVNFAVRPGELRAIIGPNGAGKSTFLKLIFGELAPDKGQVFLKGQEVTHLATHFMVRRGIAKSYQITNVFPRLSTLENVRVALQAHYMTFHFWKKALSFTHLIDESRRILDLVGLPPERNQELACNLSHGEQRTLEIAISLTSNPQLLLLDEPTAGMSGEETSHTISLIQKLAGEQHLTIILVEHKIQVVNAIAERVTVLHQGKVIAEGTPEEIQGNEDVKNVYFRARK